MLDNAIENASLSEEKKVSFQILPISPGNVSIIIENSFSNKKVDLQKIYEKGFSSKNSTQNTLHRSWSLEG